MTMTDAEVNPCKVEFLEDRPSPLGVCGPVDLAAFSAFARMRAGLNIDYTLEVGAFFSRFTVSDRLSLREHEARGDALDTFSGIHDPPTLSRW